MGFKQRIKHIRKLITVTDLFEKKGIVITAGERMTCPIHQGQNPMSFLVKRNNYGWQCFSCGRWGDVVELAKHLYGFESIGEAIDHLEEELGLGGNDLDSIRRRLTILTKEEQEEFDRLEYFKVVSSVVDDLLIESRPDSIKLRTYYFMITDEMTRLMLDLELLVDEDCISDDGYREKCVNAIVYARQYIPWFWGCVRQHLIVMRRLFKEIHPNKHSGKLLCKMIEKEWNEYTVKD